MKAKKRSPGETAIILVVRLLELQKLFFQVECMSAPRAAQPQKH
jgi:hypothetical protein